ncbi:nucleotidyltransferase family protein [Streptomyces albipurpureus]|uniref:Nucleotidyltransferase family protein n=1 Tax=Streptomyces albipurpureus TaxID=2897419 RepID=A0ABT0UWG5_9ACTN|nr:nucleotidyltransferase family protein [Streptomyces sp. CWNU-1]MCM2392789.1 nucleotidyltransferase family protein [Streptomyces sp. CWNU-1]
MTSPPDKPVIAGLLLAAGGGQRLGGRAKALLQHRGRPLVEHAVQALRDGGCGPVHVVLGAAAERVRQEARLSGCTLVDNTRWADGMGSSLRAGLTSLANASPTGRGVDAALVSLVDQPGVGAAAIARVRSAFRSRDALVAALYGGERGHPVLMGVDRWQAVASMAAGDRGARDYLMAHRSSLVLVECGDVGDPHDIDTVEDLPRLK